MLLKVKTLVNNPIASNCHIIYDSLKRRGIVVDPGSEDPNKITSFIKEHDIRIDYVILTHEHFDHIWSSDVICAPVLCTRECSILVGDAKHNLSFFFNQQGFILDLDTQCVEDLETPFEWNNHHLTFYKNGAHSPGGLMFVIDRYVVTGDLLIKDLKTVTKLKSSKKEELPSVIYWLQNLKGRGLTVLAGHGDSFELDNYDLNKIY